VRVLELEDVVLTLLSLVMNERGGSSREQCSKQACDRVHFPATRKKWFGKG